MNQQPPKSTLDALFYKMKADYLRYIYECLSGDNGLLYGIDNTENFKELLKRRTKKEISIDELHSLTRNSILDEMNERDPEDQYTLLKFMEHEVIVQYEFAMREICQSRFHNPPYERVNIVDGKPGI